MIQRKKKGNRRESQDKRGFGAFLIPAGLFLGMGFGFLLDKLVVGMFLGLGVGFLLFGLVGLFSKKK